jgi:hypothetical protein
MKCHLMCVWISIRKEYPVIVAKTVNIYSSRIWGSHSGEYEDGCLLGCSAVYSGRRPDDGGSKDLRNVGKVLPDYTLEHFYLSNTSPQTSQVRHTSCGTLVLVIKVEADDHGLWVIECEASLQVSRPWAFYPASTLHHSCLIYAF